MRFQFIRVIQIFAEYVIIHTKLNVVGIEIKN